MRTGLSLWIKNGTGYEGDFCFVEGREIRAVGKNLASRLECDEGY